MNLLILPFSGMTSCTRLSTHSVKFHCNLPGHCAKREIMKWRQGRVTTFGEALVRKLLDLETIFPAQLASARAHEKPSRLTSESEKERVSTDVEFTATNDEPAEDEAPIVRFVNLIISQSRGNGIGYTRDYLYGTRLRYTAPPKFLPPVPTTFGVTVWIEVSPAFDLADTAIS
jgi:hypothetical protein